MRVQFLVSKIRERFWILCARREINRVIHKCVTCLRHSGRNYEVDPATLPATRTDGSHAFQHTGVDLAGPLHMKNGEKAWLVLFTCAVFSCVHLEYVTSLCTETFLNALERFINTRRRPDTAVYSDNGTNFVLEYSRRSSLCPTNKVDLQPSIGSMVGRLVGATHQNCQKFVEKNVGQCQAEL